MLRLILTAVILGAGPVAAGAACFGDHSQQAMSCAEGTIWDETKGACVEVST